MDKERFFDGLLRRVIAVMSIGVVFTAFAGRLPMARDDVAKMAKAREILWRENALTGDERLSLMEMLRNPHPDVAATAFVILVVRKAQDVNALHEISNEALRHHHEHAIAAMAERFAHCSDALTTNELAEELKAKGYEAREPGDYMSVSEHFHDILAYLLLRQARMAGKPVAVPEGVQFHSSQKELLRIAFKPESEAWEYLYGLTRELDAYKAPVNFEQHCEFYRKESAISEALSAYSKIFFEEVYTAMQSEKLSDAASQTFRAYMWKVMLRLDDNRQRRFAELLVRVQRPQGIAENILWSDSEPSDNDYNALMRMVNGPSSSLSAYALSVIIARYANNRKMLLKTADDVLKSRLDNYPNTVRLAEFIKKSQGVINEKTLRETLKAEKVPRDFIKTPESYLRIVLVNLLAREARKGGRAPAVPKDVRWDNDDYHILEYAFKPTEDAWSYLCPKLSFDKKIQFFENPRRFFQPAMSAYPKVFFNEAVEAIRKDDDDIRSCCFLYLKRNAHRLDEQQFASFLELLKEYGKPWHFLW